MILDWVRRALKHGGAVASKQPELAPFRPILEALEDRFMPAAIRDLPGFRANSLTRQDDSPSVQTNVGFNLNFFGVKGNQVYVNNNGDITFGAPFSTFTPTALNSANGGTPIIAPFFADVDTRPTAGPVVTYGTDRYCGHRVFGVNWFNVGYFSQHLNFRNSFQVILIDRSETGAGNFDIEFNYNRIQWETGDASGGSNGRGGSSAAAGYTNGTGNPGTFFELPGSHVNGAFLDGGSRALASNRLRATTLGRYHFQVRGGVVGGTTNREITSATKTYYPLRYAFDSASRTYRGNFTVVNVAELHSADECFDIVTSSSNTAFQGPITVVFTQLPANVQLANRTGTTKSGRPYITIPVSSLRRNVPVRVAVNFLNPANVNLPSFFNSHHVKIYAGKFDPTKA